MTDPKPQPPHSNLLNKKYPIPKITAPRVVEYVHPTGLVTDAQRRRIAKRNERRLEEEIKRLEALRDVV